MWNHSKESNSMRKFVAIAAALGFLSATSLTPVLAASQTDSGYANTDISAAQKKAKKPAKKGKKKKKPAKMTSATPQSFITDLSAAKKKKKPAKKGKKAKKPAPKTTAIY